MTHILLEANPIDSVICHTALTNSPYNKKHFSFFKSKLLLYFVEHLHLEKNPIFLKNYSDCKQRLNNCLFFEHFEYEVMKRIKDIPYEDNYIFNYQVDKYNIQSFYDKSIYKLLNFQSFQHFHDIMNLTEIIENLNKNYQLDTLLINNLLQNINNCHLGKFRSLHTSIYQNSVCNFLLEKDLKEYFTENKITFEIFYTKSEKSFLKNIPENYIQLKDYVNEYHLENKKISSFTQEAIGVKGIIFKMIDNFNMPFNIRKKDLISAMYRIDNYPGIHTIEHIFDLIQEETPHSLKMINLLFNLRHDNAYDKRALSLEIYHNKSEIDKKIDSFFVSSIESFKKLHDFYKNIDFKDGEIEQLQKIICSIESDIICHHLEPSSSLIKNKILKI